MLPESKEYPELLKYIGNSPSLLLICGHFEVADQRALAVVGTRKLRPYGWDVTQRLVE